MKNTNTPDISAAHTTTTPAAGNIMHGEDTFEFQEMQVSDIIDIQPLDAKEMFESFLQHLEPLESWDGFDSPAQDERHLHK
jgi:hypothetical protein